MGIYANLPDLPDDPIFGLTAEFAEDTRDEKLNLAIGVYKTENLTNARMHAVYEAERKIIDTEPSKVYLPISGNLKYLQATAELVFGKDQVLANEFRMAKLQSLGGTGALSLGARLLFEEVSQNVHLSNPTWPNHKNIMFQAKLKVSHYPYYNTQTNELNFSEMLAYFSQLPPRDVVLLQASCHNPTGLDLTNEQWKELSQLFKQKQLIAFFDVPYQGFGEGLEADMFAVRHFIDQKNDMLVAVSHSKSFGLYGERVGALFVFTENEEERIKVTKNTKRIIRTTYSNPPRHGVAVVEHILHDKEMKRQWATELESYRTRIQDLRLTFLNSLKEENAKLPYEHLANRKGMFCFTGLTSEQAIRLREEFAIYMTTDGRINISGLNKEKMPYVVDAFLKVGG